MGENDKSSEDGSPSPDPASGTAPSGRSTLRIVRENLFGNAKKTLQFLDTSEKDRTVKVRVDDKTSYLLLMAGLILTAVFLVLFTISETLRPVCLVMALLADLLLGASVIWFVVIRFGVLRTMDPRYAVLCFQLLIGTGIMFTYFSINVAIIFLTYVFKCFPGAS